MLCPLTTITFEKKLWKEVVFYALLVSHSFFLSVGLREKEMPFKILLIGNKYFLELRQMFWILTRSEVPTSFLQASFGAHFESSCAFSSLCFHECLVHRKYSIKLNKIHV